MERFVKLGNFMAEKDSGVWKGSSGYLSSPSRSEMLKVGEKPSLEEKPKLRREAQVVLTILDYLNEGGKFIENVGTVPCRACIVWSFYIHRIGVLPCRKASFE